MTTPPAQPDGVAAEPRGDTGRVPRPLALLLAVVLVVGLAWAFLVPPWQAPDENSHFAYAQSIAERFELPGRLDLAPQSSEQLAAAAATEADQVAAIPQGRPPWSPEAERRWRAEAQGISREQRADGGGPNPASSNPPLYYLYAAGAYELASGEDAFARFYLQRLAGVLWALLTAAAAWLLAGEVLGRRRLLQLVAASVAGLVPMVSFVSASISPDGMLYALWTLALWLGARVVNRGASVRDAAALSAVVAAAILVKATSYALVPAAVFALAVGLRTAARTLGRGRAATAAAAAVAALAVPLAVWWSIAAGAERGGAEQLAATETALGFERLRHFASYLWQFYLPRLPFQNDLGELGVWEYWVKGAFGRFGWLEVTLPDWLYGAAAAVAVLVIAGLLLLVRRAGRRQRWAVLVFLGLAVAALVAGLHWTDFNLREQGRSFMQGRYLLPLIGVAGVAAALALTALPARRRPAAAGILLGFLLVSQLVSLAVTLTRFHA